MTVVQRDVRTRWDDEILTAAAPEGAAHLADQIFDRGLGLLEEAWCHCEKRQGIDGGGGVEEGDGGATRIW